jgi:peptidoglycan/LPS O-acetylase OafA/YrhL
VAVALNEAPVLLKSEASKEPNARLVAPRCPRYQALDFWRGIACLLVLVYHSTLVHLAARSTSAPSGSGIVPWLVEFTHYLSVGVPLFFVISGYCIAAAADTVRQRRHSLGAYFVRRFRRIYPPFWVFVMGYAVVLVLLDCVLVPKLLTTFPSNLLRPWWFSGWQWLGNLTLTETWRSYLVGTPRGHFPGHDWTLCYEEQFYAVTGLLLLLSRRYFFSGVILVTVATVVIMRVCAATGANVNGWFFDGYWLTFAAGMLVYYRINYASGMRRWYLDAVLILALVGVFLEGLPFAAGSTAAFVLALGLSLLHRWDNLLATSTLAFPIVWCGRMCYSLYLVHQLPTRALSAGFHRLGINSDLSVLLITVPCCMAVSIPLAWLFHVVVERRFLNVSRV